MALSKLERETIITYNEAEAEAEIYTYHRPLQRKLEKLAQEGQIPCQKDILRFGGTDAGAIHQSRAGVYTGGISIPTRYVHTPLEMADAGDIEACAALVAAFAQAKLD